MKVLVSVLIAVLTTAVPASAQISFSQRALLRGTTVVVFNATDDQEPIRVILNERSTGRVIDSGRNWSVSFGSGPFFLYNPNQQFSTVITVKGCEESRTKTFVVQPPNWATDRSFLGTLALTQDYLDTTPSEKELKGRIGEIRKFLDDRLGRKRMMGELNEWFDAVKRTGLSFSGVSCDGPSSIEGVRVNFNIDSYNESHRAIAIYVRGSRTTGYRLEPPRWIAW